ncbi:mycofactocin system transcriptional regulator [Nocardia sp. NPDC052254]|uniref:mycofactocin system transcriptional regulator n=1 Tax=Nocardia sp. NPDC052254 TaxID=3155681 RepID=UPI00343E8643
MPETRPSRRGRPPETSARALEVAALLLFGDQGFHDTTVEQIAAAAGVSRRTFFRYFDSKTEVLWHEFDTEVETIRTTLTHAPTDVPIMAAIRHAVLAANHYRAEDVPELRLRMHLLSSVPDLIASAAVHYDAWERAISDFVATRTGRPAHSLYALGVGRATLAVCRSAYDHWTERADDDLTVYLDTALRGLESGFRDEILLSPAHRVYRHSKQ